MPQLMKDTESALQDYADKVGATTKVKLGVDAESVGDMVSGQQDSKPAKLKYERTAEKYRKGSRKHVYTEREHNQQSGVKPGRNSTTDKNSHKANDSSYSKGVEHGKENYVHKRYGRICLL